jgi:hypothetical protein
MHAKSWEEKDVKFSISLNNGTTNKGRRRLKLLKTAAVKLQTTEMNHSLNIWHIVSCYTILNFGSSTNFFFRVIYVWVEVKICTYGPQPQPSSTSLDHHSLVRHCSSI